MNHKLINNLYKCIRCRRGYRSLFITTFAAVVILIFSVFTSQPAIGQTYNPKLVPVFKRSVGRMVLVRQPSYTNTHARIPDKKGTSDVDHTKWIFPVIPNIGGVHPRPKLPIRPDPKKNYKIFVDIVSSDRDPSGRFKGLKRLARLVNLMAYSKVPADHVHIVAVLDGESGYASAINAFYQKQFKADNPNLSILHELKKAGIKLMICSQALAEHGMPDKIVDPDVIITLSALTDAVVYGQKGYSYMQL